MRIALSALLLVALVACTKPNPNSCCVTEEQCAAFGADELRPCAVGQACAENFTCVAAECETSIDCTDPNAPICSFGLCVSTCRVDEDCAEVAGRTICASDGVCVGCEVNEQCSSEAAICDSETRACRGCEADDECESGVCIEATGVCADVESVIFVSTTGQDTGTCTSQAPCGSIGFAIQLVDQNRSIIHVRGNETDDNATITVTRSTIIDGPGTSLDKPLNGPVFDLPDGATSAVIIEGIRIENAAPVGEPTISVGTAKSLTLHGVTLDRASVTTRGTIAMFRSTLTRSLVSCSNGSVTVESSAFNGLQAGVDSMNCQTTVQRSRFTEVSDGAIDAIGALVTATNNIFVLTTEFADLIRLGANTQGSTFAFNTIVNLSTVANSPVAVQCDSTTTVSSNIIAYNSTNPLGTGCVARASLFDLAADASDVSGNTAADVSTFFVDRLGGDLHLAPNSPALGAGEAGIVAIDFDGNPRPAMPDVGAFEAP